MYYLTTNLRDETHSDICATKKVSLSWVIIINGIICYFSFSNPAKATGKVARFLVVLTGSMSRYY